MIPVARKFVMVTMLALLVMGVASAACQPAMTAHNLPAHNHDQPCHISQTSILQGSGPTSVSTTAVVALVFAPAGYPKSENDVYRQILVGAPAPWSGQSADQSVLCTFRV